MRSSFVFALGLLGFASASRIQTSTAASVESQAALQVATVMLFGDGQHLSQTQEQLVDTMTGHILAQAGSRALTATQVDAMVDQFIAAEAYSRGVLAGLSAFGPSFEFVRAQTFQEGQ